MGYLRVSSLPSTIILPASVCLPILCFVIVSACVDPESFVRGGPTLTMFPLRADVGPTANAALVFQGIRTSITEGPYIFVFFFWGGAGLDPLPPPLNPHMVCMCKRTTRNTQS